MSDEPKYSIQEAADMTRYSKSSLRRWEHEGKLTPHRTPGNARRYSDADIAAIKAGLK